MIPSQAQAAPCDCDHVLELDVGVVDGAALGVQPGESVCVRGGPREFLRLQGFVGAEDQPIVIRNCEGVVDIDNDDRGYALTVDRSRHVRARLNLGGGRFGPPVDPLAGARLEEGREIGWIGDLDGAPGAELVVTEEIRSGDDSMKAELAEAKRPKARVTVHALGAGGVWHRAPRSKTVIRLIRAS